MLNSGIWPHRAKQKMVSWHNNLPLETFTNRISAIKFSFFFACGADQYYSSMSCNLGTSKITSILHTMSSQKVNSNPHQLSCPAFHGPPCSYKMPTTKGPSTINIPVVILCRHYSPTDLFIRAKIYNIFGTWEIPSFCRQSAGYQQTGYANMTRFHRYKIVSRVSEGQRGPGRHQKRSKNASKTIKMKFEISFFYIFLFSFFFSLDRSRGSRWCKTRAEKRSP